MSTAHEIEAMWNTSSSIIQQACDQVAEEVRKEIDNELIWSIVITSNPDWTCVSIPDRQGLKWHEVANWMIERFGLPRSKFELPSDIRGMAWDPKFANEGGTYFTNAYHDKLDILFKHEKDAIMTILRWK